MAKIPLRAYNREIEGMIDQGQTLEAVAHCQHILKTFPKCLDSYRLLGKAYLELQRFSEAADVFNRLLLAVPEDFIANLGMSIIYDDQKNLDAAIWHMERAFETQSSNPAIQGELRRLYSRRDGMEPPKIRLTRGALAQMYARGDQFQQAVSEIKSVLAEEPQRMDLQVLLARVYFRAGQRVEATEFCTTLLKKYPYCLDANRILIEILPLTSRADATQVYRHRVNALDPYSAFAAPSIFNSAEVADAAVSIEKLSYQPDAWAPAKFGLETAKEEAQPDWLSSKETAPAESIDIEPTSEENIPEWMKVAGWAATTAAAVEAADRASADAAIGPEAPVVPIASDDISSGEVPDWLANMAPPGALNQPAAEAMPAGDISSEDMKWLDDLGATSGGTIEQTPDRFPQENVPGFGAALGIGAAVGATLAAREEEPVEETPALPADETPDWLTQLGGQSADATAVNLPAVGKPAEQPVTDWLTQLESQAADATAVNLPAVGQPEDDLPDWLVGAAAGAAAAGVINQDQPAQADSDLPDWLKNAGDVMQVSEPVSEIPAAQPSVQADNGLPVSDDDAFAWLESLAAKQGAKPEELLTKPEDRPVETPDWLGLISEEEKPADSGLGLGGAAMAAGALFDDEPAEETIVPVAEPDIFTAPSQTVEPSVLTPAEEMSDEDAFSWLESLAAKQGAKPEELLTKPEDRADAAPAWALMGAAAVAATQEPETALPQSEAQGDLTWLQSISSETPIDETTIGEQVIEETIFTELAPESIFEEKPVADATMASAASADEVAEWLHQLDVEDTLAPAAAVRQPAYTTEELPDWLKDEEPAELLSEDLPDWLKGEASDQSVVVPAQKPEWVTEQPQIEAVFMTAIIDNEPDVKEIPVEVPVPAPVLQEPAPAKPVKVASAEKDIALYENSKLELERGNLPEATQGYRKLIKRGKMLEEIIFDLREAQYRHPVDVVIWQTLGDAYMRANRLQDALDAYTKAEELLR